MSMYIYLEGIVEGYKKGHDEQRLLRMINSALKYEYIDQNQYNSLRYQLWEKKNSLKK